MPNKQLRKGVAVYSKPPNQYESLLICGKSAAIQFNINNLSIQKLLVPVFPFKLGPQ